MLTFAARRRGLRVQRRSRPQSIDEARSPCCEKKATSSGRTPSRSGRILRNPLPLHALAAEYAEEEFVDPRVPATIITGFLGSGKTTLLNRILSSDEHALRIAVIENEFGEIGIDQELVTLKEEIEGEDIMLLNNGCMCCTVRNDLVELLNALLTEKAGMFDHILIETTGLAHPMPIIGTFFTEESISDKVRLDGVVTVVDANNVLRHLHRQSSEEPTSEVVEQVAYADKLIINKIDLVNQDTLKAVREELSFINSMAKLDEVEKGQVGARDIFELGGFDLERIEADTEAELQEHDHDRHHHHDDDEHEHGHDHNHEHDHFDHTHSDVMSVSIEFSGSLDLDKINEWLGLFLVDKSEDVYRMKGIFAIDEWDEKFIFQGVHAQFEGMAGKVWREGEERLNKAVFIGRNLDSSEIEKGITSCLA